MKVFIRVSVLCLLSLLVFPITSSALKPDETAVFYPTDAALVNGRWEIPVHGWIFEPEEDSAKRAVLLDLAKNLFDRPLTAKEETNFKKRAVRFLADSEEDKRISLKFCGEAPVNAVSTDGGQLFSTFSLPPGALCDLQDGWIEVKTVPEEADQRIFTARSQLVEAEGVSVVSDIDDTIKFSKVADKKVLMANTFLNAFRAVDGMSIIYRKWRDEGARFHYLSAGPWQLYEPLSEFMESEGFPRGSFYLKTYRFSPSGLSDVMNGPMDYKIGQLTALFERYPKRKFILVGDDGESDPEIYGQIARKYPMQVAKILIRQVDEGWKDYAGWPKTDDSARFKTAFEGVEPDKYLFFAYPYQLSSIEVAGGEVKGGEVAPTADELLEFKTRAADYWSKAENELYGLTSESTQKDRKNAKVEFATLGYYGKWPLIYERTENLYRKFEALLSEAPQEKKPYLEYVRLRLIEIARHSGTLSREIRESVTKEEIGKFMTIQKLLKDNTRGHFGLNKAMGDEFRYEMRYLAKKCGGDELTRKFYIKTPTLSGP